MEIVIDIMLYLSYVMFGVGVVAAIGLPVINSLDTPSSLFKPLAGIFGVLLLFVVCWLVSSSDLTPSLLRVGASEDQSKFVGGALVTMYTLFFVSMVGIVYTEVSKFFK